MLIKRFEEREKEKEGEAYHHNPAGIEVNWFCGLLSILSA